MSYTQIDSFRRLCREEKPDCWICGEPIDYAQKGGFWYFNVDHYIPRYHGGTDDPKNLRPSHMQCNSRRGHRLPEKTIWIGTKEHGRWHNETFDHWERRLRSEQSTLDRREARKQAKKKRNRRAREQLVGAYPISDPIKIGPGLDNWPPSTPQSDEYVMARVKAYHESRKQAHASGAFDERLLPPPEYRNQTRRIEEN
ncbi:HNH endonuclease [Gordonia phage Sombrero]|uniref:HNH endonuclease n=1 Tax=Gordonia phage Sombrero TaxID=2502420 RepID=A0A411BR08_9CAUD|nr:HNH endonuclease [Gordonia phage Sombrero]QAY04042.1 HNH endonuclease [Gordonia phage Sombrero]QAY16722.1 HNH endonuclease [Gordonia phage FelixAlejandro]